jgi:hypothetical protein
MFEDYKEKEQKAKKYQKQDITSHLGPKAWTRQEFTENFSTKEKKANLTPWRLQDMHMEIVGNYKVVGLSRDEGKLNEDLFRSIKRNEVGAISEDDKFWKLYAANTTKNGFSKGVGHYLGVEDAKQFFEHAERLGRTDDGKGIEFPHPDGEINLDAPKGTETRWLRGSGSFAPAAGCMTDFAKKSEKLKNSILAQEYHPGRTDLFLLPLVTVLSEEESGKESPELDKKMRDDIDQGAAVLWNFKDWGKPTSVVPARVIFQPTPEDPNRHRAVKDYRYLNGIINRDGLLLPDHIGISIKTSFGNSASKQDLKSGYHQVRTNKACYHLVAVSWNGRVYAYTCMSFGMRDAPKEFQARTKFVAEKIFKALHPKASEVYLDDFIQIWQGEGNEEIKVQATKNIIVENGFVISSKKCKGPCNVIDILGLELNINERLLRVSNEKNESIRIYINRAQELGKRNLLTTKDLAQLLGKLVSVEPAMPHLMLLTRQLFEELKNALVEYKVGEEIPDIRRKNDASSIVWGSHSVRWSEDCQSCLEFIVEKWDELNGQSLDPPGATLIIKTDASEDATGGRTIKVKLISQKEVKENLLNLTLEQKVEDIDISKHTSWLTMDQASLSSTAREAWAIWLTLEDIREEDLQGKDIVFATDNQGLAKRLFKGSTNMSVNEPLLKIVTKLLNCNARWSGAFWLRRTYMKTEDELSRERGVAENTTTNEVWFRTWKGKLPSNEVPNIDLFASKDNAVCARFASFMKDDGGLFDGAALVSNLKRGDIPYMFPTTSLLSKALNGWEASESEIAYLVVPASTVEGRFKQLREKIEKKYGCVGENLEAVTPWYIKEGTWKFVIYRLEKK